MTMEMKECVTAALPTASTGTLGCGRSSPASRTKVPMLSAMRLRSVMQCLAVSKGRAAPPQVLAGRCERPMAMRQLLLDAPGRAAQGSDTHVHGGTGRLGRTARARAGTVHTRGP